MSEDGYVNYFAILELDENSKPGEVRKKYKRMMKDLVMEIARVEITGERRDRYLLQMAQLNAALYVLRNNEGREAYWRERTEVIQLEEQWRQAAASGLPEADALRRSFDTKLRHFLSRYVEEAMLEAGRDKEAVEASHWDPAHERHASRILRHYRHNLYQQILDRLPYWEITTPEIDWAEREKTVAEMLPGGH